MRSGGESPLAGKTPIALSIYQNPSHFALYYSQEIEIKYLCGEDAHKSIPNPDGTKTYSFVVFRFNDPLYARAGNDPPHRHHYILY